MQKIRHQKRKRWGGRGTCRVYRLWDKDHPKLGAFCGPSQPAKLAAIDLSRPRPTLQVNRECSPLGLSTERKIKIKDEDIINEQRKSAGFFTASRVFSRTRGACCWL